MNNLIVRYPSPLLRLPCNDVFSNEMKGLRNKLMSVYDHKYMLGLAAPQIGINKKAFVAQGILYINPRYEYRSNDVSDKREACLSLLEAHTVPRYNGITLTWFGGDNKERTQDFTGFTAEVIQHEMDHIAGKLILDYA